MIVQVRVSKTLSPSPFLPTVPNMAFSDLGRVKFPSTIGDLLRPSDRDPRQAKGRRISGPSSYTRRPTTNRVGGQYPPHVGSLR